MSSKTIAAAAAFTMFGLVQSAGAAPVLTGSLTADYLYPDSSTVFGSSSVTVGTPLNCPGGDGGSGICPAFAQAATITASGLSITLEETGGNAYTAATFNGVDFSGLTFSDASMLTGFTLSTNLAGLTASDVSFTANSIEFNAQGDSFDDQDSYFVTLDLTTGPATSSVPEPMTLSLFGAGLLGAAFAGRRRKAKA